MALFSLRLVVGALLALAAAFLLSRPAFSRETLVPSLAGQVAVVTGGSRGIGKGIAVGLGEAGATVYITGRTLKSGASNNGGINGSSQSGSLEETCQVVVKAGGECVPVAVDSADDKQLEQLFAKVIEEKGRLDILVNNAFSAVSWLPKFKGKPFWEKGLDAWDQVNNVGLRSHYIASVLAAQAMVKAKRGLIVNVGSFGGNNYIFDVAYGVGKAAMDRMANDMAIELATDNVTMVSLWPGLVKTENIEDGALERGFKERRGMAPGTPDFDMESLLVSPLAETPLFSGRAVAAFARDVRKQDHSGKVLIPSVMASGYGLLDERGVRSPPFISMKFLLAVVLKSLLQSFGIWEVQWEAYAARASHLSAEGKFFWNTLPDFSFPGFLVKLGSGAPNL